MPVAVPALLALVLFQTAPKVPVSLPAPPSQDLTLPPETATTVAIMEGRGVQIYTCSADAEGPRWTFQAPEAQLFNLATGKPAGHHDAGPAWTLNDGSSIHGSVLYTKPPANATDVPWLLLKTTPAASAEAASARGELSPVTYVRRYNTHGGAAPPSGCDRAQIGKTLRVPYSATYAFYATPGSNSYLESGADITPASPKNGPTQP